MSPHEAEKIINALANGINPETGEALPKESTFENPKVIRALFVAVNSLDFANKHVERDEKSVRNGGSSWTEAEHNDLRASFEAGNPVHEIANQHGRTQAAITSRLLLLGIINNQAEAYSRTVRSPEGLASISQH